MTNDVLKYTCADRFSIHPDTIKLESSKVLSWDGTAQINPSPWTGRKLSGTIHRLIYELLRLPSIPRNLTVTFAYIKIGPPNQAKYIVVYDCIRSGGQAILPGFIDEDEADKESFGNEPSEIARRCKTPNPTSLKWTTTSGIVRNELEILSFMPRGESPNKPGQLETKNKCSFHRYVLGEFCRALPLPPFPKELRAYPKAAVVLADQGKNLAYTRNKHVWSSLKEVSRIANAASKQIVLFKGSPGSGKELYARALHYLSPRADPDRFIAVPTQSISFDSLMESLCGYMSTRGEAIPGDISRAEGGTLLLDEFDKACSDTKRRADFYKSLLRILEAKEYRPVGGTSASRFKDVSWFLAGAFKRPAKGAKNGLDDLDDIWSRMSDCMNLKNPVITSDRNNKKAVRLQKNYARALASYWLFTEVCNHLTEHSSLLLPTSLLQPEDLNQTLCRKYFLKTAGNDYPSRAISPSREAGDFTNTLLDNISRQRAVRDPGFGVRSIRQAVRAATRILIQEMSSGRSPWTEEAKKKAVGAAISVVNIRR